MRSKGGGDEWDLKPIYRSLSAAYGWTYGEIDSHTLSEVQELFEGWAEYPPTNLLVKALVGGFGGGSAATPESSEIPPDILAKMQQSALQVLAVKAGPGLPILRGRDKGLPKAEPIFDVTEMQQKNVECLKRRALERTKL